MQGVKQKSRVGSDQANELASGDLNREKSMSRGIVFDAYNSDDLAFMLAVINEPAKPIDRHFLLMSIVKETYRLRDDPVMRETCRRVARRHLNDLPEFVRPLKRLVGGFMPRVSTFEHLTMILSEDGEYDEAVHVAEMAVQFDVFDESFIDEVERRNERFKKKRVTETRESPP